MSKMKYTKATGLRYKIIEELTKHEPNYDWIIQNVYTVQEQEKAIEDIEREENLEVIKR